VAAVLAACGKVTSATQIPLADHGVDGRDIQRGPRRARAAATVMLDYRARLPT
jgi:hypothetical protein